MIYGKRVDRNQDIELQKTVPTYISKLGIDHCVIKIQAAAVSDSRSLQTDLQDLSSEQFFSKGICL